MKKLFCFTLALLVLLTCLTACNLTQNASGALAGSAEATPKVEEMMAALAANRTDEIKSLMHPNAGENTDVAIAQLSKYLAGRTVGTIEQKSINVSSSTGTSGKTRQEQVAYRVTLSDGEIVYLKAVYNSDRNGTGFLAFQMILGIV